MISLVAIIILFGLVSSNVSTTAQVIMSMDVESGESGESAWDSTIDNYSITFDDLTSTSSLYHLSLTPTDTFSTVVRMTSSVYDITPTTSLQETASTSSDLLHSSTSLQETASTSSDLLHSSTSLQKTAPTSSDLLKSSTSIQETVSTSSDLLHPSTSIQETVSTSSDLLHPSTSIQETVSTSSDLLHPSISTQETASTSSDLLHPSTSLQETAPTSSDLLHPSTSIQETSSTSSNLLHPSTSTDNSPTNIISTPSFTYISTTSIQMSSFRTSSRRSFYTSSPYIIPTSIISLSSSTYDNVSSTTLIQKSSFTTSNRSLYPSSTISRRVPSTSTTPSTKLTDYIDKYVLHYLFIWIAVLGVLLICVISCCCCCCFIGFYARRKRTKAYTVQVETLVKEERNLSFSKRLSLHLENVHWEKRIESGIETSSFGILLEGIMEDPNEEDCLENEEALKSVDTSEGGARNKLEESKETMTESK